MMTDYTALKDEELCAFSNSGDGSAEEALLQRYVPLVRSFARPFFLAGGDSEDLIQEGMLGLLSAVRSFDPARQTSFKTYAVTCIENRLYSAIRSAAGSGNTMLNEAVSLELIPTSSHPEDRTDPERLLIDREGAGELWRRLDGSLSELERQILREYLPGKSYKQIAKKLGRSEKAVDNGVQRIRKKLETIIQSGEYSES